MPMLRIAVLALGAVAFASPALAGDDGVEVEVENEGDEYEYEYEDARCKFSYEYEYGDDEPEVEVEGDCPPPHALPRFAPPVPYRAAARPARRPARGDFFCDRALAGAIGSQVAPGDDRAVAIILGGIVGGVLGHEIGRRIDTADRRCIGRALAHAEPGIDVAWTNPGSDLRYDLRRLGPVRDRHGVSCRRFEMRVDGGRWRDAEACRRGDGGWQLVSLQ